MMLKIVIMGWGKGHVLFLNRIHKNTNFKVVGALLNGEKEVTELQEKCRQMEIPTKFFISFDKETHDLVKNWNPDIIVSISFTRIIPQTIISTASIAALNLHLSALPKYRGVHPLNWAIINDESTLGVTVHLIEEGIDSGPIVEQQKIEISDQDDINYSRDRLLELGSFLLLRVLEDVLATGKIKRFPQNSIPITFAPKRTDKDSRVTFNAKSRFIFNMVRADRKSVV